VDYQAYQFGDPSFNIVINTSKGCKGTCPGEKTYIAGTVVYLNNDSSSGNLPKIQMFRSYGWTPLNYTSKYADQFGPTPIQSWDKDRISNFFKLQTGPTQLAQFETQVIKFFHSKTGEYESWGSKDLFGQAITSLPECETEPDKCTLMAYLFSFTETPSGKPTLAVRFNAGILGADGVIFKTRSPIGDGVYDNRVKIIFNYNN